MKNRTRIDIYAAIIETIKKHPEGIRLTRITYGAGIPTDRARKFLNQLMAAGLVKPSVKNAKTFVMTKHGRKFLESYYVLKAYLDEMKEIL
ncbi:MAG: winged helix-turn-helix domain-containing protein [Candidatus Odinarchaeota archaeon]